MVIALVNVADVRLCEFGGIASVMVNDVDGVGKSPLP